MSIYIQSARFNEKYDVNISAYLEFVNSNKIASKIKYKTQAHHILPRWAFPEYSKLSEFSWNNANLSHKNHLIAHFLLAKVWPHYNNYSAIIKMCKFDTLFSELSYEYVCNYSEIYKIACESQAKRCSEMFKGIPKTLESILKGLVTKHKNNSTGKGIVNAINKTTNENIRVTCEEYYANDNLYVSNCGKPAWNKNIGPDNIWAGKLSVLHKETQTKMYITTEEYHNNKNLYAVLIRLKNF